VAGELIAYIRRTVVVGVDGTEPALRAVRWGAREAVRRGGALRLVIATVAPVFQPMGLDQVGPSRARDAIAGAAVESLDEAADVAADVAPGVEIVRQVRGGSAPVALHAESEWAGLVVVGTRGRGPMRTVVLGSVAAATAATALCPVVVVRGEIEPRTDRAGADTAGVVVPADGSAAGRRATAFAYEEARRRGSGLLVVHAGCVAVPPDDRIAGGDPQVPIRHVADPADAESALVTASSGAALLVVGVQPRRRSLGGPAGRLCRSLLRTAHCPVAVVRTSAG
jgi:nucleotide-binding universal stress UspA family protein